MTTIAHSVSLDDADASRDELEALRDVLRRDEPYSDECPTLEDEPDDDHLRDVGMMIDSDDVPDDADRAWWAVEGERRESDLDEFLDDACPEPEPELLDSGCWGGHQD